MAAIIIENFCVCMFENCFQIYIISIYFVECSVMPSLYVTTECHLFKRIRKNYKLIFRHVVIFLSRFAELLSIFVFLSDHMLRLQHSSVAGRCNQQNYFQRLKKNHKELNKLKEIQSKSSIFPQIVSSFAFSSNSIEKISRFLSEFSAIFLTTWVLFGLTDVSVVCAKFSLFFLDPNDRWQLNRIQNMFRHAMTATISTITLSPNA